MKRPNPHVLDPADARRQWTDLAALLNAKARLSEGADVLPFFRTRPDLSLLVSHYIPAIRTPDRVATELPHSGDFRIDLVVGDHANGKYLLVEFEDGTATSVFAPGTRAAPAWAARYERAFSQLVDWLWKLDDMRSTSDFVHLFGAREVTFEWLIVAGKGMALDPREKARLRWRIDKVRVHSRAISFVSFDDFLEDADHWLRRFYRV